MPKPRGQFDSTEALRLRTQERIFGQLLLDKRGKIKPEVENALAAAVECDCGMSEIQHDTLRELLKCMRMAER